MHKLSKTKITKIILFVAATILLVLLIICPALQSENKIKDLTGHVGIIDNYGLISSLSFPCQQIYAFGDLWCHQISNRSIFINGNQMPVCARCLGIFIGVPLGMLLSIIIEARIDENIHKRILMILLVGYIPTLVDSLGQIMGIWSSINVVRLITGALTGLSFSIILGSLIDIINFYVGIKRRRL